MYFAFCILYFVLEEEGGRAGDGEQCHLVFVFCIFVFLILRKGVSLLVNESSATWSVTLSTREGEAVFMRKRESMVGEEEETIQ